MGLKQSRQHTALDGAAVPKQRLWFLALLSLILLVLKHWPYVFLSNLSTQGMEIADLGDYWRREIWRNWRENQGFCANCPNRDCETSDELSPDYGAGGTSAEYMLVTDEPNMMNDNRTKKNNPEGNPAPKRFEDRRYSEHIFDKTDKNWNIIEEVRAILNIIDGTEDDIYITTSKKCANLRSGYDGDVGEMNNEAERRCVQYLHMEVQVIGPSTIFVAGNKAVERFTNNIPIFYNGERVKKNGGITGFDMEEWHLSDGTTVIPVVHWSYAQSNREPSGAEEYWEAVFSKVN